MRVCGTCRACVRSDVVLVQFVFWCCFSSVCVLVLFQFSLCSGVVSVQFVFWFCFSSVCVLVCFSSWFCFSSVCVLVLF